MKTPKCTHFTWTEAGLCCLKEGTISKDKATWTNPNGVCGIVEGKISYYFQIKYFYFFFLKVRVTLHVGIFL